jgi:hypothetical protein
VVDGAHLPRDSALMHLLSRKLGYVKQNKFTVGIGKKTLDFFLRGEDKINLGIGQK